MQWGLDKMVKMGERPRPDTRLAAFVDAMRLVSLWRAAHPGRHQYSSAANSLGTLSQLDCLLVRKYQMARSFGMDFPLLGISDRSPLTMLVHMGVPGQAVPWRLDAWELMDMDTRQPVIMVIDQYFAEYEGSDQSAAKLWEAYKSIMRGQLIARVAAKRKDREVEYWKLEEQLILLKTEYIAAPSRDLAHRVEG
ncbi:hypothetical protein NDU88_003167 [Pleurodeles waltl]|uniref:Uncharacterized protein n=1 Tax=Pleurodeles waltl TaxID=8319 RepID=A0AAV7UDJ1_PLEWA|nr:hypothetical protein NDU88_003167 [Pleurodeles waltl]